VRIVLSLGLYPGVLTISEKPVLYTFGQEITVFDILVSLYNSAFCVGFLGSSMPVSCGEIVYSGGDFPAVLPWVSHFRELISGTLSYVLGIKECQECEDHRAITVGMAQQ